MTNFQHGTEKQEQKISQPPLNWSILNPQNQNL
ncbi:hypothetical protein E2C01_062217 [Portunus trituberculatus]|uniref:Uncharacterized protein n=1 Tax=Portunus trituberculatus TaxID=210409 RepID=A0A5B7HFI6_PORTR|nr:hypothetical protein [Portunus trituberculatus]